MSRRRDLTSRARTGRLRERRRADHQSRYVTVAEAAEIAGVSVERIQEAISLRLLRRRGAGRRVLVRRDELVRLTDRDADHFA